MEAVKIKLAPARNPIPHGIVERMRALWNLVPHVQCKGLCAKACTNVPIQPIEALYLIQAHGADVSLADHGGLLMPTLGMNQPCAFLKEDRCSIYHDRPMVCRLYGHDTMTLQCAHGCEVTGVRIGVEQVAILLAAVTLLGMVGRTLANTGPAQFALLLERQIADLDYIAVLDTGDEEEVDITFSFTADCETPGRAWEATEDGI